jgi:transmembrane sensor
MKKDMSEDVLIKYILGEAGLQEAQEVESWVALNPGNAKKLEDIKMILETGRQMAQQSPLGEAEAWENFKELRGRSTQTAKVVAIKPAGNWLRIAAAVVFLIGGAWIAYNLYGPPAEINILAGNTMRMVTLPDSSKVYINKNSAISYTSGFKLKREIKLTGEAFFDVVHNEQVPFSVSVNGITVKDIGTTFNIKSSKASTEVVVESGIVEVSKNASSVRLNPQDRVSIKPGDKDLKVERNTELMYGYYTNRAFVANKTPLWQLVNMLNKAYTIHIRIENNTIRNYPISITIPRNFSVYQVLDAIKLTTPQMQVTEHGTDIVLK